MLNILFISKNLSKSLNHINYILQNNTNCKIYSIVANTDDGIKILNTGKIDISVIFLDENVEKLTILNTIKKKYYYRYQKSFLIISKNTEIQINNPFIYKFLNFNLSHSNLLEEFNKLCNNKLNNSSMRNIINSELTYIGYNLSHSGTKYISDSIMLLYDNINVTDNLKKDIYPIIAKKYKKKVNTIKCDIARATSCMYYECEANRLKEYFKLYSDEKPKPKTVIFSILNKILYLNET